MPELSVIIVNYNVRPFLERALESIFTALKGIPSEVYVVDNGSGDGSVPMIRKKFPSVKLIENEENVGFARANNQALREAKGDMVCLINPDTLVREDTFKVCMDYLQTHSEVGVIGCKILNSDGTLQLSCRRSFPMPWVAFTKMVGLSRVFPRSRVFGRYNMTYLNPDETTEVEAISGSFMMVLRRVVNEVGYLDEDFFMYGEDLDWCYRIGRAGWKIVYLPKTWIIHHKGQSTREASFDYLPVFFRAMRLFVKKHFKRGWSFFPQWFLMMGIGVWNGMSLMGRILNRWIVPLIDAGFLQLGLLLAILIRFGNLDYWPRYRFVNLIYTGIWIGCLFALGVYRRKISSGSKPVGPVVVGLVINTSLTFFLPQYAFSRPVMLMAGILDGLFLGGWRSVVMLVSRTQRIPLLRNVGKKLIRTRAVIVGTDPSGQRVLSRLKRRIDAGYEVVGFLGLEEKDLLSATNGKLPVMGTVKDLVRIVSIHHIQEVIFSPETIDSRDILSVIAHPKLRHLDYKMVPRNADLLIGRASMATIQDIPLVDLDYKIYSGPNRLFKRTIDLGIAVVMLPLNVLLSLYMFCHPKYRFRRSLISDGMGRSIPVWEAWMNGKKVPGWLWCAPMYLWILLGRMSLVGTEIVPYDPSLPGKGFKPGLKGLVQVNEREGLKEEERDMYNLYYLRNYSPLLDLDIIWRSFFCL